MTVRRGSELDFRELPGRWSADPFADDETPVSVRVVRIAPNVDRSPHRHPHSCEVVYVAQGSGTMWRNGTTTDLAAGDIVLIPAGMPHATIATGGELRLVCFFPHPDLASNTDELDGIIRL
jgi:quercetin dioxygenase-like cupin family protein